MFVKYYSNVTFRKLDSLIDYESSVSSHQLNPAEKLQWNISLECANDINTAKVNLDKYEHYMYTDIVITSYVFYSAVSNCDHQVFVFEDFGKRFVKSHKLSPDSFIQVAIQLTYYK